MASQPISLRVIAEDVPLAEPFRISRIELHHSQIVVAELTAAGYVGRGECEPHESDPAIRDQVVIDMRSLDARLSAGMDRDELNRLLPSGPIRNALDCALWDLQAKLMKTSVAELAGLPPSRPIPTVFTLGMDSPDAMADKATLRKAWTRLKIKLGSEGASTDLERVRAVRKARPDAELIVDANGGWSLDWLCRMAPALADQGVALIEQPLAPGHDAVLEHYASPVPLCADESCLDRSSLPGIVGRYQYINIKLDKTGGLTEALALADAAQAEGLGLMVGCMTGTSLAMAPAHLIAQRARFIDLDGPLLLARDRTPAMRYDEDLVYPPEAALWG